MYFIVRSRYKEEDNERRYADEQRGSQGIQCYFELVTHLMLLSGLLMNMWSVRRSLFGAVTTGRGRLIRRSRVFECRIGFGLFGSMMGVTVMVVSMPVAMMRVSVIMYVTF